VCGVVERPEFLPRRQVLYLDAIEESFRMVTLAYRRLQASLLEYGRLHESRAADSESAAPDATSQLNSAILLDAWSVVDVLNRLRVMVRSMPGVKKASPGVESFVRSLEPVEILRNAVQHLYGEVDKIADTGHPIWGSLSWAVPPAEPGGQLKAGMFLPGTLAKVKGIPIVNPVGRKIEIPVGLIEMTAAGVTVSLSEMVYATARFADRLEHAAQAAFESHQEGRPIVFNVDVS
jgi:hypothetical protein